MKIQFHSAIIYLHEITRMMSSINEVLMNITDSGNTPLKKGRANPAREFLGLVFFIIVTFGVAFWASRYEPGIWYAELSRPSWTPPNWAFPVAWTILYFLMSVAAWLVWRQRKTRRIGYPLAFYFIQLLLNGLWSWIFFGNHLIDLALIDIILLFMTILVTTILFWKKNRLAGILFIPYLIWVGFATTLNTGIWLLN